MPKRTTELSNVEVDEISLVDVPANQYASVLIAKRDDTQEDIVPDEVYDESGAPIEDIQALDEGSIVFDADGAAYQVEVESADADEDEAEVEAEEPALVGKSFLGATGSVMQGAGIRAKQAGAAAAKNKGKIAGGAALGGTAAAGGYMGSKVGKSASFADEIRESLSKALGDAERDEVISKAMEQVDLAEQRAAQAEEIAKAERDLRLLREYTEVAKNYNVPVEPDELGPVLMRMAETLDDADLSVIHKALTAAGEALYNEIGYIGGGDNVDVLSQVDQIIDGTIQKNAEGSVSKAGAMADFFDQNPEAYDQFLAERRGF